ncbi:serine/threonine protein phosphatase, partial [Campylobacter jejuni]|nr:serine/threonine protein phosphatase [Campylobacter jejuni]
MRILLVLRGNYYAGQEEFIKNNKLQNYTLDLNALRLLSGSVKNIVSEYKILNVKNDEDLSKILLKLLEMRMQKGEFCIINAYNETLKIYKDLAKQYRYKMYVIVFDSSLKQCQEKNLLEAKKNGYIIPYALLEKTQDLLKKNPKKYPILDSSDWKKCL